MLTFLRLPGRHQATLDELYVLMQRFSKVITEMNALESEFLVYHATPDDEFQAYFDEDDKPMHIDHIWHKISKQIDVYSGQLCFKHLEEFAKFIFLIPRGNSYCEIIFSTIRKICTDGSEAVTGGVLKNFVNFSVFLEKVFLKILQISLENNALNSLVNNIEGLPKEVNMKQVLSCNFFQKNLQYTFRRLPLLFC